MAAALRRRSPGHQPKVICWGLESHGRYLADQSPLRDFVLGPRGVGPAELLKLPARQNRGSDSVSLRLNFLKPAGRTGPLVVCHQGFSAENNVGLSTRRDE